MKKQLETKCIEYFWNMGKKTICFQGSLRDLLKKHDFTFTKKNAEIKGLFIFHFKNSYGVSFKVRGTISDFSHLAKQAVQMELVRMGDKSMLSVNCGWRPTVTVNH